MMAIVDRNSRFTFLDRQTGEGAMPGQSQEDKNRQWQEVWRGEADEGSRQGQAPSGEPTEDRSRESGRSGAAQGTEKEVT